MKIALGQINTTVGDLSGNVDRMVAAAGRASSLGADLIAVRTKDAAGRFAAKMLHPSKVCEQLRDGAARAIEGAGGLKPLVPRGRHEVELAFLTSACAPSVIEPCDDAIHLSAAPAGLAAIGHEMAVGAGDTSFIPPTTGTWSQGAHWDGTHVDLKNYVPPVRSWPRRSTKSAITLDDGTRTGTVRGTLEE